MRTYTIIVVTGMVFLSSGCSLSHYYDGKSPIEIEQYEHPKVWKEVYQIQVTLWPLEKKVNELEKKINEMRDELATTKLSAMQANKQIESLQAEIQQIKSESLTKEKTSADMSRPAAGESKKAGPDIQSTIITDIQYYKVSDTQDKVLIYVNAMNNPKLQTVKGKTPRVILDFVNTRNIAKENYEINTNGNFIKRIRIRSYRGPIQKVRVVFDMMPNKKYTVDQKFSKKEKIYSFDLKAN
ncbi:MAG: AMIN domain-containing protein [Syntrophales bacterium]